MSGLGEKIKEVFGGHHHDSTSSDDHVKDSTHGHEHNKLTKDTPGHHNPNRDSAIGGVDPRSPTTQTHQPGHVDPETEAKQATSAAGNFPYWGDLPRDQEREANPDHTTGGLHSGSNIHDSSTGHSGLEKGALGAGAAAAGAGYLAHEHDNKPRDNLPGTTATSSSAVDPSQQRNVDNIPATATTTSSSMDPLQQRNVGNTTSSSTAGPAAAAFEKDLPDRTTAKPTSSDNASTAAQVDPLEYPPRYDQGHGKRDAELAGAGLAGAAGAGYLAHRHNDEKREKELEKSRATPATTSSSTKVAPTSAIDQQRYTADPVPKSQQPTSTSNPLPLTQDPNTSGAGASDRYHDYKKEEALAGGAGLAGVGAGAGYLASRHNNNENDDRRNDRPSTVSPSSAQRETTAGGLDSGNYGHYTGGGVHNTVVGAGSSEDPHSRRFPLDNNATTVGPQHGTGSGKQEVTRNFGAPKSHDEREKQALAAAAGVGAGAGLVGAEEKHRHNKDKVAQPEQRTAYHGTPAASSIQPSSTTTSTPAQAAAQQAWSKQDPATAGAGYGQPNPYKDDSHNNDRLKYGAAGAGALAGAGATAAYYGQGKEHNQNPRSAESEKIADRALGGTGNHSSTAGSEMPGSYPQDTSSSKLGYAPAMSNAGSAYGGTGGHHGSGIGAKVLHKCHQCGADNDISEYFNKDASFRMGS